MMSMLVILLETYQTVIISIVASLVGLYILAFIAALLFALHFQKKIQKRSNIINMLISERKDAINQIIKFAEKNDLEIKQIHKKNISRLERINDFQKLEKKDRDTRILDFLYSSSTIVSICSTVESINKSDTFQELLLTFNDVEGIYRKNCGIYNSDIVGYNYWVNLLGYRYLFKLFRLKTKDLIV